VIAWQSSPRRPKHKRVSLTGTVPVGDSVLQVTVRGSREAVWTLAARLAVDTAAVLALADSLANGIFRAARGVPRRPRQNALRAIKEIAAAVFLLIEAKIRNEVSNGVAAALATAERQCEVALGDQWRIASAPERARLLTAFVVHRGDPTGWALLRLRDPFHFSENTAESFYRRYIHPALAAVQASLEQAPLRSLFLQGLDPRTRVVLPH
jgi:hypothetical protein